MAAKCDEGAGAVTPAPSISSEQPRFTISFPPNTVVYLYATIVFGGCQGFFGIFPPYLEIFILHTTTKDGSIVLRR